MMSEREIEKICSRIPIGDLIRQAANRFHGDPHFYQNWMKMATIHDAKNRDYAGGQDPLFNLIITEYLKVGFPCPHCGKECIVPGEISILIRKLDKVIRDITLLRTGQAHVKDESSIDSNIDEAVYSLLEAAYKQRKKGEKALGHG